MSLNWSLKEVPYYKENPDSIWVKSYQFGEAMDDVNPEAKALIFGMMSVGMSGITETSVAEFYGRWKVIEMIEGLYVTAIVTDTGDLDKTYMTPNIANKYIGMTTNCSKVSLTNWSSQVAKSSDKYSAFDIKAMVHFYTLEYKNEMGLL